MKKTDEYGYIPRYQNMPVGADNKMFNDLMDKMTALYCKWYGSAYGLSSADVTSLKDKIQKGKTTFTQWKREFEDAAYKGITGHTLTEERQKRKEQKAKDKEIIDSIYDKIVFHNILTTEELKTLKRILKK